MTATMPNFSSLMSQYALADNKILDLISKSPLFDEFQKCRYQYLGEIAETHLLELANQNPSSLIIVNKRRSARELFRKCSGEKYHLSTYMTAYDRRKVLRTVKQSLRKLAEDFPDGCEVPLERRITIISTSLIEAGVDLDVHSVFRELTGLDSVLQAGGRCNREGLRTEAITYVFELESEKKIAAGDERANITRGLFQKYPQIACPESISEYYERLFFLKRDDIQKNVITQDCCDINSIPFKAYAERFELIDSQMISVVVPRDEKSQKLVDILKVSGCVPVRELQNNICVVYWRELDSLIRQQAVDDFGTGVYCLTNLDYYDDEVGIIFEAKD